MRAPCTESSMTIWTWAKFVPGVLSEDERQSYVDDSRKMVEWIVSNPSVLESLVTCKESWVYYEPESKRQNVQWKHSRRPGIIYSHWVSYSQIVNKEYYAEVLWQFRKRFYCKRPELFNASAPGQCPVSQIYPGDRYEDQDCHSSSLQSKHSPMRFSGCSRDWRRSSAMSVLRKCMRWRRLWETPWTPSFWRTIRRPSWIGWSSKTSALKLEDRTLRERESRNLCWPVLNKCLSEKKYRKKYRKCHVCKIVHIKLTFCFLWHFIIIYFIRLTRSYNYYLHTL